MTKKEIFEAVNQAADTMGSLKDAVGVVIVLTDSKGCATGINGSWSDNGLLTGLIQIRNEMINKELVDILVEGEEVELN